MRRLADTGWACDSYGGAFPWPTIQDDDTASLELLHPSLDNAVAPSWRSSTAPNGATECRSSSVSHRNEYVRAAISGLRVLCTCGLGVTIGAVDPTREPNARNSVLCAEAPTCSALPQIYRAAHTPQMPAPAQTVRIELEVSGAESVSLLLQVVTPGQYISEQDPLYESTWETRPMHVERIEADAAGVYRSVFVAEVSPSVQCRRCLIRCAGHSSGWRCWQCPDMWR